LVGGIGLVNITDGFSTEEGIITSAKQLRRTGRSDGYSAIEEVDFHSSSYMQSFLSVRTQAVESEALGIGPYLDFHRDIWSAGSWSLGATLGWSVIGGRAVASNALAVAAQVRQRGQLYTYSYDVAYGVFDDGRGYPLQVNGIVVSTQDYTFPGGGGTKKTPYLNPRKSSAPIDRIVTYLARTSSTLDATLHSLAFSADLGWKPLPRLEFSLSGGPTLNVLHSDLTAVTEWTEVAGAFLPRSSQGRARNGPTTSALIARDIQQASSTAVKIGAGLLAHLRYDLTPDGRWYAEARGGYQWLSPVDVGEGKLHATLDASSWDIGGGLGCRLGQGGPCLAAIRSVGHSAPIAPTSAGQATPKARPKPPGYFGRLRELWQVRRIALDAERMKAPVGR
jgi:hypothetical protein